MESKNERIKKAAWIKEYLYTIFFNITPLTSRVSSLAALPFLEKIRAQIKQTRKTKPAIKKRKFERDQSEKTPYFNATWKVSLPKKYENKRPFI